MKSARVLAAGAAVIAGSWLAGAVRAEAADAITIEAAAGLGSVAKPGRWTPVRLIVQNSGDDLAGEILIQWGTAVVRRSVVLSAGSRSRIDAYVRTPDAREAMVVRVRAHGSDIRNVDVPVRVLAPETEVTMCVVSADSLATDATACTMSVTPNELPRSMRGYDVADRLIWNAGPDSVLGSEERTALAEWRAWRQLNDAAVLSLAPRLSEPTTIPGLQRSLRVIAAGTAAYLLVMLGGGLTARGARNRPLSVYAVIGLLIVMASSAALAVGRVGPGSAVTVRHASTIQQLPGGGAIISMRGTAELPSFSTFDLRAGNTDSVLDTNTGPRTEQRFDENGYPLLSGTFGLGSSQAFALDGVDHRSWLGIERRGDVVRATNVSRDDLYACRFPDGFSSTQVGTLRAGQSVEAMSPEAGDGAFFVCTLHRSPIDFTDPHHAVETEGVALVSAYIPAGPPGL